MEKDPASIQKKSKKPPCRRRKRRTKNIQQMAEKRQATKRWLETHIWHAKRCKMVDIWGYRLALHPNEKCVRSSFKASQTGSTIHDASYHSVFEVSGEHLMFQKFISELEYTPGLNSEFHLLDSKSSRLICPILLLVRPGSSDLSQCWIIVHPSAKDVGQEALFERAQSAGLSFTDISEQVNIFELCGSKSSDVISKVLGHDSPQKISSLLVRDPRFTLNKLEATQIEEISDNVCSESLWNIETRTGLMTNQTSEDKINDIRASKLIPGQVLEASDVEQKVPVLIRRFDRSTLVFLPKNWARPFWRAFVFAGARFIGLEQTRHNAEEVGLPVFPYDYPGTDAYEVYADHLAADLMAEYNRKPPGKRINYEFQGVQSPFKPAFPASASIFTNLMVQSLLASDNPSVADNNLVLGEIIMTEGGCPDFNSRVLDEAGETVIGFMTQGFFSLSKGKGSGIAACSLSALLPHLDKKLPCAGQCISVMLQNLSSPMKRKASFTIAKLL